MKTSAYGSLGLLMLAVFSGGLLSCNDPILGMEKKGIPEILFEETFEGPAPFYSASGKEIGNWDYALQYVSTPVFQGTRCARFEIREDQPMVAGGKRAEVVVVKGTEGKITKNTWYSFAVYFPDDYFDDHTRDVVCQWYKDGSPVRLLTEDSHFKMDVGNVKGNKELIDLDTLQKNTWHEFVFHFIHSNGNDGVIEVWQDGDKKVERLGGNMYTSVLPKWKIGIYKAAFEYGTSDTQKRIVYFDNVRVGNGNSTYTEMMPNR